MTGSLSAHRLNYGQSMVESMIALPLLFMGIAGAVQLCWVFLAVFLMHTTTAYISIYAAADPDDYHEQLAIFWHRMNPLPGKGTAPPIIEIILHDKFYHPEFTTPDEHGNEVLSPHFAKLRLASFSYEEQLDWLQFTTPTLRVRWCFPLKIPLINHVIAHAQQEFNPNQYCLPTLADGSPSFAIEREVRFTLKNDFVIR